MISIWENIHKVEYDNKIAIIMCDKESILESKTFGDIVRESQKFQDFFISSIKTDGSLCVGLVMEKNIFLPSIILSLQKLKYTFVCLAKPKDYSNKLNVEYILTYNVDSFPDFEKVREIVFDDKTFIIWKKVVTVVTPYSLEDIFCIIQSSGTTGANKIIRIHSNCIESNTISLGKILNIHSQEVIFWGTPLTFDPSLIELLLGLLNGSTLILVTYNTYINPKSLYLALFNVVKVTVVQMVPSVFHRWDENVIEKIFNNSSLRILAFGGEVFPRNILKYKRKPDLMLFNLYGITEVSCWATVHQINEEQLEDEIPIGKCLDETFVEVRDENGEIITLGEGEIYIGSNTRKCYVNDEIECFFPLCRESGDIGFVKNNNIYYKGRKNKIVKRFGHKVNLAKVEEIIFRKCNLTTKSVWSEKNQKLLLFILIKENYIKNVKEKILDKIRIKILNILSQECFPDYFEILQTFPTTSHGKINEKKLEEYYLMNLPKTDLETVDLFCKLWCKYLGICTDNFELENYSFFELGGNSINVIQLLADFKELTNIESSELVAAVFEKKLRDCKNLLATSKTNTISKMHEISFMESVTKKMKMDVEKIKVVWKYDLKACVDASPLVFIDSFNNTRIAIGSFCNLFIILCDNGYEVFKDILTGSIESTALVSNCKTLIYIGCYDGTLHCINFIQKRTVWTFKTADRIKSTPIFLKDGFRIVFGSYDKYLYCLSSQNGSLEWKTALDSYISANIVYDEFIGIFVTTTGGFCYCIAETNGDIIWKFNCGTPIFGTPCIFHSKELIIVPSVFGILFCLSLKTGELFWKYKTNGHIFSSLVTYNDYVICGCHDKNIYLIKISPSHFELLRKTVLNCEISSTPVIYRKTDFLFIIAASNIGTIYLIDFETFSVIQELKLPGEVFSSPVVYENKVYTGCRDNNLYCLSLDL